MEKVKIVGGIIGCVIVSYLVLLATFSVILSLFQSAAATLAAKPNIANFPGVVEIVSWLPYGLWFLPAIIGTIALVIVLRQQGN